jgi:hypothetical protein
LLIAASSRHGTLPAIYSAAAAWRLHFDEGRLLALVVP